MIKRRRMMPMIPIWMLIALVVAVITTALHARQGVVTTRDGQRYEGEITEKSDSIIVNIRGVETVIDRANIANLAYSETFDKQYVDRLAKLAPDDVAGRISLSRWAFEQKQYDKAREACDLALNIDPNNKEAHEMLALIRGQIRMEQARGRGNDTVTAPVPVNPRSAASSTRLLSAADVNSIRLNELNASDKTSIRFENDVKKRFVEFAKRQHAEFSRMRPVEQALDILGNGDSKMINDVKVMGDPAAMLDFRRTILPVMLNSCATVNCHGNAAAGGVQFVTPATSDTDVYTNFYLLSQWGKGVGSEGGGFFGGSSERKMIERGQGERSVLANYMLPKNIAEVPHPAVAGYEFVFRSKDDPRYKQLLDWMNLSLKSPPPDYGIDFAVPKLGEPSTQPAGR